MNTYIKPISCFCFGLLLFASCSKSFLDEEVRSDYELKPISSAGEAESSIIGLYNHLSTWYSKDDRQGWLSVWQSGTDIVWPTQPESIEVPYFEYDLLTSDDDAAYFTWQWAYEMIYNANIIIADMEDPELVIDNMTEEDKNRVNAEARFFRALSYDILGTCFGGVPLTTEPLSEPRTDYVRASLEEINTLIEEDLLFALNTLPEVDGAPAEGRVNKYVAAHLLAVAYLRMGEAAKAEEQCNLIIDSGKYSLVTERYGANSSEPGDPFSDMFIYGNQRRSQGNTEAIWVLEAENPSDVPGGMTGNPQQRRVWGGAYHNRKGMLPADSLGGRGLSRMRLNNWVLYDLYEVGDMRNSRYNIRREHWYNDPDDENYGQKVPYMGADTLFIINPYTMKWRQFDPRDTFGYGMWKDFILMRLGETYLLRAEAQLMQGKQAEAAISVNAIRERANAPLVTAADIDMDFILDERVRELVGEENRRMTLMRTGTLLERAQLNTGAPNGMQIRGLTETHLLLPIPLQEIQLNKDGTLEQNPGY
ncbi:RagB/SusD family nutrient uptake outer membrane protein [Sinomicrobium weinanense]|uniref:RagB/SusD family nutrient uptake outer membrane protein n=1 Tax=Sinomicrobium weinanense TaxID=2842200 RepID=A0A926JRI4_9FLAO|nr:RagB/SusD family nutrient uptake outer membrane protein [Sinomicrobium weinanense]MBC9796160.1 RagB/SusD family nutrient uptake outer membrane protein [Sinomicrobium weinanense]MBU3121911.1 RagB/SusD family nutrient uptake outer membrane protein [Sinomicrobium weinanense]